ncbi:hypothetical protein [Ornithinimicrobium kibberense]|uniref:hypothetical protein n=1 Tax=Ornithinimicrobium kibberense TaxID=282060 RepID=UPI003610708B
MTRTGSMSRRAHPYWLERIASPPSVMSMPGPGRNSARIPTPRRIQPRTSSRRRLAVACTTVEPSRPSWVRPA